MTKNCSVFCGRLHFKTHFGRRLRPHPATLPPSPPPPPPPPVDASFFGHLGRSRQSQRRLGLLKQPGCLHFPLRFGADKSAAEGSADDGRLERRNCHHDHRLANRLRVSSADSAPSTGLNRPTLASSSRGIRRGKPFLVHTLPRPQPVPHCRPLSPPFREALRSPRSALLCSAAAVVVVVVVVGPGPGPAQRAPLLSGLPEPLSPRPRRWFDALRQGCAPRLINFESAQHLHTGWR